MSETLSHQQDPGPDSIHSGASQLASHGLYTTLTAATVVGSYPSQPGTPHQDVSTTSSLSNLPPFSTFTGDVMDPSNPNTGYGDQTRLLDISNWDYYSEGLTGRLLERNEHGLSIISSQQPQYRPWESTTTANKTDSTINTFADAFAATQNHHVQSIQSSKLPSFQSQFQAFSDTANHGVNDLNSSPTTLTQLTPMSPSSTSPNFHTLSTVNPRSYPLVPAPIQAREIPTMQQQFLEERHIQLYSHPTTGQLTTLNNAAIHFPTQNGTIIQNNQLIQGPVLTVIKTEPSTNFVDLGRTTTVQVSQAQNFGQPLHHSQFQNPLSIISHHHPHEIGTGHSIGSVPPLYNGIEKKLNGYNSQTVIGSPTRNSDYRKKERRKIRASSLESSTTEGSDGANSNMDGIISGSNSMSSNVCENSGQVPSISSTAGFKSNHSNHNMNNANNNNLNMDVDEISGGNGDKQVKKKRKRCGECIGCQRKDNCGDCAPCRNDKSHQICKQRRCEKLTEKKMLYAPDGSLLRGQSKRGRGRGRGSGRTVTDQGNLYAPDGSLLRGESRRGRGKGRGSYRGRKAAGGNAGGGIITSNSGLVTSQIVTSSASVQHQQSGIITTGGISLPEVSPQSQSAPTPVVPSARPSPPNNSHLHPQQVMLKPADQAAVPPTHQPMTPMPFYADPNRFPTPVWQTDPSQGWPQGQFIQQIPAQPGLEAYHTQQYANPTIYQANYPQTPTGFEATNTFYTGPVQVLTNQRPPSASSHTSAALTPRPTNGSYATHTPSPSPIGQNVIRNGQPHQQQQPQYATPNDQYQNYQPSPSPNVPNSNDGGQLSRPSSVSSNSAVTANNNFQNNTSQQNFAQNVQTSSAFTPQAVTSPANFSPNANTNFQNGGTNYNQNGQYQQQQQQQDNTQSGFQQVRTNGSGNGKPGYPPVNNSNPPQVSHNSSGGYPGQQYGGQPQQEPSPTKDPQWPQYQQTPPQNWDQQDQFSQPERVNLNSRIKMINKDDKEMSRGEESTGHFLLHSHHRRQQVVGGGHPNWTQQVQPEPSAIENFMKFADNYPPTSVEQEKRNFPIKKLENRNIMSEMRNFRTENQRELLNRTGEDKKGKTQQWEEDGKTFPRNVNYGPASTSSSGTTGSYSYTNSSLQSNEMNNLSRPTLQEQHAPEPPKFQPEIKQEPPATTYQYQQYDQQPPQNYQNFYPPKSQYQEPYQNYQYPSKPPEIKTEYQYPPYQQPYQYPPQEYPNYPDYRQPYIPPPTEPPKVSTPEVVAPPRPKFDGPYLYAGDGGPMKIKLQSGSWCCRQGGTENPTAEHLRDGACAGLQTQDEILADSSDGKEEKDGKKGEKKDGEVKKEETETKSSKNNAAVRTEIPECSCFSADKNPPEPGSFYTHLGTAASLADLRKDLETRTGLKDKGIRIEKVCYTGKEGKTTQGCPLAKWIIRRSSYEEKILAIVKHRQGHTCITAYIVVCIVAWDGIPSHEADRVYNVLTHKLNRYGLPTTRRCATNEPRTCACQGLDPDTCGASFSFGCSWSMYYNGCKYARSKTVRKFRLSVKTEENEIEERMHVLATILSPLYLNLAPEAFRNQCHFEREASECRLGFKPGRPFSGVTACIDFCAHSHRDLHNMNNGCTVVVSLTKHRSLSKPPDEQLHVLPLYIMDETDEHGSKEGQQEKIKNGSLEALTKFPCEVRVRSVPLQPCRRHGKKRKEDEPDAVINGGKPPKETTNSPRSTTHSPRSPRSQTPASQTHGSAPPTPGSNATPAPLLDMVSMLDNFTDAQLQSSQVSSTVLDSPTMYPNWSYDQSSHLYSQNQYHQGQYGPGHGQYPPPPGGNWMDPQAKQRNIFYNGWDSGYYNGYKEIKEDPDSTTMNSMNSDPDPNLPPPESKAKTMDSFLNLNENEFTNLETPADPTKISTTKSIPESPPVPSPATSQSNESWSNQSTYETPDASPFRIPKGRPPSRTQNPEQNTFLKPFPPTSPMHRPEPAAPPTTWQQEDVKPNYPEYQNSSYPGAYPSNPGYGNYHPGFGPNPYTAPPHYNPYDQTHYPMDYVKREEYFRNPATCYNPYYHPQNYPNWNHHGPNWNPAAPAAPPPTAPPPAAPPNPWFTYPPFGIPPYVPEQPKSEPIGEVTDFTDNEECFKDSQMGGVAIALGHGSVLFEVAKHEMHCTTALRKPNRLSPSRISLVFYQHRNLNRPKHGLEEWEQKMRLRKLGITTTGSGTSTTQAPQTQSTVLTSDKDKEMLTDAANSNELAALVEATGSHNKNGKQIMMRAPTLTTMSWTTLFPMHPCCVTGPYQENGTSAG